MAAFLLRGSSRRQTVGLWGAWVVTAFILVQAGRSLASPVGFSGYFGLPLGPGEGVGFVLVYGVRALFLGVCTAALLLQRRWGAVSTFAFAATVMPIGDLALVASAGGPALTVARHALIAVVLFGTGWLLREHSALEPGDGR